MNTLDSLDFTPSAQANSRPHIIRAQSRFDLTLLLRNGEQLLLMLVIPLALLVGLTYATFISLTGDSRINIVTPGILALAVMSTAFTSLAISTGFDRRYGVLKYLGVTPLGRSGLVASRSIAVLLVEIIQLAIISAVAFALGWHPAGNVISVLLLLAVGTAAFASWALVIAGWLRAEATLAVANAIFLVLLMAGSTIIPSSDIPGGMAAVGRLLPSGALGDGLREVLTAGNPLPIWSLVVLAAWAVVGTIVATRTFKWE